MSVIIFCSFIPPVWYFTWAHLFYGEMTSWEEMGERLWELIVQMLPFSTRSLVPCLLCPLQWLLLKNLISQVMTSLSAPCWSTFSLWDSRWQLTIRLCSKNLLSSPFIHTCIQMEKFTDTQRRTNRIIPPLTLLHRHTRLPFHPKETVHIQTNRGDAFCPNAIILYCPSPWLLWDKGPSVDEASSVWMGG